MDNPEFKVSSPGEVQPDASRPESSRPDVDRLMMAVLQQQDAENATHALHNAGLYVTRMSSSGAFLGVGNVTLLIGLRHDQVRLAVDTLNQSCRRRVEYLATSLEGSAFQLPLSAPVTVGGATVFLMKIERWEVIL